MLKAANHLLDIVKRDRKWNEDGARKQLVQFFEAWGGADEATDRGAQAAVVGPVFVRRLPGGARSSWPSDAIPRGDARSRALIKGWWTHADQCNYRGPGDLAEIIAGVSAAWRAAAAARTAAAEYFRAALSGDGRRRAARRPSPDRHDPAGHHAFGRSRASETVPHRLRRPHHPVRRDPATAATFSSSPASRASARSRKS